MAKAANISHISPVKHEKTFKVCPKTFMRSSFVSIAAEYIDEHEHSSTSEAMKWLKSLKVIKASKYLKVIAYCDFRRQATRTCLFAGHGDLRIAIDLMHLTFLLDDITDHEISSKEIKIN